MPPPVFAPLPAPALLPVPVPPPVPAPLPAPLPAPESVPEPTGAADLDSEPLFAVHAENIIKIMIPTINTANTFLTMLNPPHPLFSIKKRSPFGERRKINTLIPR
jgi:hypothetical protein